MDTDIAVSYNCYYYSPRTYVLATSDRFSEAKLVEAEAGRAGQYSVVRVARAREVGQVGAVSLYSQLTWPGVAELPQLPADPASVMLQSYPSSLLTLLVLCCRATPAPC